MFVHLQSGPHLRLPIQQATRQRPAITSNRASSMAILPRNTSFRGLPRFVRTHRMACNRFVADRLLRPILYWQLPIVHVATSRTRLALDPQTLTFRWCRWKLPRWSSIRTIIRTIWTLTLPSSNCRDCCSSQRTFSRSECPRWRSTCQECWARLWHVSAAMVACPMVSVQRSPFERNQKFEYVCPFGRYAESQALSPELQWVDKRIISNSQCTRTYGPSVVLMSTVCTIGGQYNEQGTCNGDSGGPLIIDEGGVWTQIGVVSFVSNQGCGSGYPAGYVRTTSFLNWIAMHTGIRIRIWAHTIWSQYQYNLLYKLINKYGRK